MNFKKIISFLQQVYNANPLLNIFNDKAMLRYVPMTHLKL